jgi:hypothetical protein
MGARCFFTFFCLVSYYPVIANGGAGSQAGIPAGGGGAATAQAGIPAGGAGGGAAATPPAAAALTAEELEL